MNSPDILKAVENKMDNTLLVYAERNQHDSELHRRLIEDLKAATTEFLELRRQYLLRRGRSDAFLLAIRFSRKS